ncbi:MAG TPA: FAD-dependent oxidoreductase, partial [Methylomirabilota bacterium]|nr:FAD-dependent oxidoreductase [Methylomirabilota bacterium]
MTLATTPIWASVFMMRLASQPMTPPTMIEMIRPMARTCYHFPVLDCGAMARRIVIVGGGLMGLSAAFHLRRADSGARVTVLERDRAGAAASGASAAGV